MLNHFSQPGAVLQSYITKQSERVFPPLSEVVMCGYGAPDWLASQGSGAAALATALLGRRPGPLTFQYGSSAGQLTLLFWGKL